MLVDVESYTLGFMGDIEEVAASVKREFSIGDRVGAKASVREQMHAYGDPDWPAYGHVINVRAQSLIWVRDHLGGEWGLPAYTLEHID